MRGSGPERGTCDEMQASERGEEISGGYGFLALILLFLCKSRRSELLFQKEKEECSSGAGYINRNSQYQKCPSRRVRLRDRPTFSQKKEGFFLSEKVEEAKQPPLQTLLLFIK